MDSALQSEEQQFPTNNTAADFLRPHYKYGHLYFQRVRRMAKLGITPKKFEKVDTPICASCMYTKCTRKPWRGESRKTPHKPRQVTYPGKIVSVYQLVSPTHGLEAHITSILTNKWYKYATVLVYQLSRYSYMHLYQTASFEETLEGNHAFESMSSSHGIIINQYHYNNGIFRSNYWVRDCQ